MRIKAFLFSITLLTHLTGKSQDLHQQQDINSIKAMCGCYEVKFNFAETFQYAKDSATYKPSKTKHESALEWIELVEDTPNKIVLQHLLIVNDQMIIKHWRQDWLYENTELYTFFKDNTWTLKDNGHKKYFRLMTVLDMKEPLLGFVQMAKLIGKTLRMLHYPEENTRKEMIIMF
jgi:hypothetical protein